MRRSAQSGFTLIELMIVVAILGIVAALALVALLNALDRARQRATMADMRSISHAVEVYQVDHGFLPDDSNGMDGLKASLVPYQTSVLPTLDHWGHTYDYRSDGRNTYSLESYGRDGVNGDNISIDSRFDYDRDILFSDGRFVAAPE